MGTGLDSAAHAMLKGKEPGLVAQLVDRAGIHPGSCDLAVLCQQAELRALELDRLAGAVDPSQFLHSAMTAPIQ